jgi:hypothetical protein
MNVDPIVEEIRKGRREHAAKFNYDLKAICNDFRKREIELRDRVVSLPPKRVPEKAES